MQLAETVWDVAVVGAGPAGAVASALLAQRGWRVALLERSAWPREKVCGGCVNAEAVALLRQMGLGRAICGCPPLDCLRLHAAGDRVPMMRLALPGGAAVSRADFDRWLVTEAVERGCHFFPATSAHLAANDSPRFRHLKVTAAGRQEMLRARIVLACDGITGTLLADEPWAAWRRARNSWFGVSASVRTGSWNQDGVIDMYLARGGYAGVVRHAPGWVHIGAAVAPAACRAAGGPGPMVARILGKPELAATRFAATGWLTRRRPMMGGPRALALGDACGYVEPFTGEGIAWAITSAQAAVALLAENKNIRDSWPANFAEQWRQRHWDSVGRRQRSCAVLRPLLRRPAIAGMAMRLIAAIPAAHAAAQTLTARLCAPSALQPAHGVPL